MKKLIEIVVIISTVQTINAGLTSGFNSRLLNNQFFSIPRIQASTLQGMTIPDNTKFKENRCLQAGQWTGMISGAAIGLLHTYWLATDISDSHGSWSRSLIAGIPSTIVSTYVGVNVTEWATEQILKGNPKPAESVLKGAFYGAVDGAVILTSNYIPFLIIGHYTDTIHFNFSDDLMILKIIGASTMGGILYGGTFGAAVGAAAGPCISVYMKFR